MARVFSIRVGAGVKGKLRARAEKYPVRAEPHPDEARDRLHPKNYFG
jgi:hypothetical protein